LSCQRAGSNEELLQHGEITTYFSSYRTAKNLDFFHAKTRTTNIRVNQQNEKNTHTSKWDAVDLTTDFLWKRVTAGLQIVRLGPSAVTLSKAESSSVDAMAGRSGFIHGDLTTL
jgi:hypothetical protein